MGPNRSVPVGRIAANLNTHNWVATMPSVGLHRTLLHSTLLFTVASMYFEKNFQQEIAIDVPVVVDLDGTLIRTDLLVESAFAHLGENPLRILSLFTMLMRGKAALKAGIAAETPIDAVHLPYDERVLALIEEARREGRKIYIASASNERYVSAIAKQVGADGFFASTETENLSSHNKASRLVKAFGRSGFDYVGNSHADLPVWA